MNMNEYLAILLIGFICCVSTGLLSFVITGIRGSRSTFLIGCFRVLTVVPGVRRYPEPIDPLRLGLIVAIPFSMIFFRRLMPVTELGYFTWAAIAMVSSIFTGLYLLVTKR